MFFKKLICLLPSMCVLCGLQSKRALNLCIPCEANLPILSHHCRQCAQILPTKIEGVCGACLKNPPPFTRTYALFPYEPPIIRLITALKFQRELSHAKLLGELLVQKIKAEWYLQKPLPDLIIPIPLHLKRLQERGFNQALEMARPIHHHLAIPLDIHGAKRTKPTLAQIGLSAKARKRNMTNAFRIDADYSNLTIAVIDDVMTTQQTMTVFCKALKDAGAAHIDVWCAARAG